MDKEEILAKSRNENKNVMDEREKAAQTKANSISQGVGLILCLLIGFIGLVFTGSASIISGCSAIYCGMFTAERIAFAVKLRSKGQWVFAGISIAVFVGVFSLFLICCVKGLNLSV